MAEPEASCGFAAPKEDEDEQEPFCTGKCTAEALIVFFVYTLVVFGCTLLTKFGTGSLVVTATIPVAVLFFFVFYVFGRQIPSKQIAYVALSTLALAVPLSLVLPVVRSGWMMVIRLLDFATYRPDKPWFVRPGYPLWSFVDTFLLEATIQELIKYAVIYKAFSKKLIQRPGDVIVYSAVASCVIATADVGMQALKVVSSLRNMPTFVLISGPVTGRGPSPHGLPDHQASILWSFTLYYAGFIVPMQVGTGFILACTLADRELLHRRKSFLQIIRWPILLHGAPVFASQILRHISHNEAHRVLHGADPATLTSAELSRLGSLTALLQFTVCALMALGVCITFILSRLLYLRLVRTLGTHSLPTTALPAKTGFLFSWQDVFEAENCST
ncbi:putative transmembrane protein [Toxoplasma gondii MAS]|uniref:Putative transmembrane protein n=1 Tax=Toxoplasma gondii MAS TaxID=943118 RepID=A0A086PU47_TOXGO|nr:putative transmembrane protein [Toxoplasma gondii MAS]